MRSSNTLTDRWWLFRSIPSVWTRDSSHGWSPPTRARTTHNGGSPTGAARSAPVQQGCQGICISHQETQPPRQAIPPDAGTGHPVGLSPRRPPGQGRRRYSCRGSQYRGDAESQVVLQEDVTATLGRLRSHTGTQSRESWCPLCEGGPSPHLHRLFPVRASPNDAPLGTDFPVRTMWTDHVQRHQLCNQHMRPGLFTVPGSGGT